MKLIGKVTFNLTEGYHILAMIDDVGGWLSVGLSYLIRDFIIFSFNKILFYLW